CEARSTAARSAPRWMDCQNWCDKPLGMTATRYLYCVFGPPQPTSARSKSIGRVGHVQRDMAESPDRRGWCSVLARAAAVKQPSAMYHHRSLPGRYLSTKAV